MRNSVKENREISDMFRELRHSAKPQKCILCGKPQSSFCSSHSIPRLVIKNIAVNGMVKTFQAITIPMSNNAEVGVAKAMTFQFICRECDSKCFVNYENENAFYSERIDNNVLAEIALKNHLFMRYKWSLDQQFTDYSCEHGMVAGGIDVKRDQDRLTLRDNLYDIHVAQRVLKDCKATGFRIIWQELLDWKAPVCIQTEMNMREDLAGAVINDVFDFSEGNRTQSVHLCVFPLKEKTLILLFYHGGDMKYRKFEKQFRALEFDQKLCWINYLMFAYTEHVLLSTEIPNSYFKNKKLRRLCEENTVMPLGRFFHPPKKVSPEEIPNFLAKDFWEKAKKR